MTYNVFAGTLHLTQSMRLISCNYVSVCVQKEKAKQPGNLSLFASDMLFATDDDSPTFDLFLPSSVSTLTTVSFVYVCMCMHVMCVCVY